MHGEINLIKIILESGLVVKAVLLLLIVASIFSWTIIFKKKKKYGEVKKNNDDFIDLYKNASSLKDVFDSCIQIDDGPYKSVFVSGYKELKKLKDNLQNDNNLILEHFKIFGLGCIERGLRRGVLQSQKKQEVFLSTLASIGSVSPFVGLFGTVWGIIDSFTGLAGGGATIDAVAPGIAEALVATAIGLGAAIPAVWYFNKFSNENEKINMDMEDFGQEILNVVERSLET